MKPCNPNSPKASNNYLCDFIVAQGAMTRSLT